MILSGCDSRRCSYQQGQLVEFVLTKRQGIVVWNNSICTYQVKINEKTIIYGVNDYELQPRGETN